MMPIINSPAIQYALTVPAHRYRQGGRDVYLLTLDLATADGTLPQRVGDAMIREANRKLTPSHARNIQEYLLNEDEWMLGALMLGVAPDAIEFQAYPPFTDFGEVKVRADRAGTMKMFDGQHRRRAIADALAYLRESSDPLSEEKLERLRQASISVLLYVEENLKDLRQMFVHASRTRTIEANVVAQFDQRDAFNLAARHVAEHSRLFSTRTEMQRPSVRKGSENLLSINQLVTALKYTILGQGRRVTRERNFELLEDVDSLIKQCLEWTDHFLPAAREEYGGLIMGTVDPSDIPYIRSASYLYSATFFNVLAGCYTKWRQNDDDWQPLADFLRQADIGPGSANRLLERAGLAVAGRHALFTRRQEVESAINYIVGEARDKS